MPEDRTTLTADASQYFDVLSRAGVAADRLGASGARVGEGFVRGERVVRTASANIAASLLSTGDAATTALVAMQGLERVFKIGILPTIGVAAGVAILETFHRQIGRTNKAYEALRGELDRPLALQLQGSPEGLASDIEKLTQKMADLRKETNSTTSAFLNFFKGSGFFGGFGGSVGGFKSGQLPAAQTPTKSREEQALLDTEQKLAKLEDERANKELLVANLRAAGNDVARAELVLGDKRNSLLDEFIRKGGNVLNFYKRQLAAEVDLTTAKRKKQDADEKNLETLKNQTDQLEKQAKTASDATKRTPGQQASEQRTIRAEDRQLKDLRNQLSNAKTPEEAADIKAQMAEIQQAKEDRDRKAAEQQRAAEEAARAAAEARAREQAEQARQAEQQRKEAQKASDIKEVQRFGRVLDPSERLNQQLQDVEAARQKKFQDDEAARQQRFRDENEAQSRGITPEQLENERAFKKSRGIDQADKGQDFSSVASLSGKDFSSLASLGGMDFKGLAPLNGFTIKIA